MQIKKHLNGGTLRAVMVAEIKRVLAKFANEELSLEKCAVELGLHHRTLRVWRGPIEKGGWPELQGQGGMEKVLKTKPKKRSKAVKRKKKPSQAAEARA